MRAQILLVVFSIAATVVLAALPMYLAETFAGRQVSRGRSLFWLLRLKSLGER